MITKRGILVCVVVWLSALGVQASADSIGDRGRADQLLAEGIELRRQHRDEDALERFRQAHQLAATARASAQIGFAEQALGLWVAAESDLLAALDDAHDPWVAKTRDTILKALARVSEHLGDLDVKGGPPGAEIRLNGELVGTLPLSRALRAPVGSATVELSSPGHLSIARTVVVVVGGHARESMFLVPLAHDRDTQSMSASISVDVARPGARGMRIAAYSMVGLGATLLAVGIAGTVLRVEHGDRWSSDACVGNGLSRGENCMSALDAARMGQTLSIAGFVVGGAVLATSIGLIVAGTTRSHRRASASSPRP